MTATITHWSKTIDCDSGQKIEVRFITHSEFKPDGRQDTKNYRLTFHGSFLVNGERSMREFERIVPAKEAVELKQLLRGIDEEFGDFAESFADGTEFSVAFQDWLTAGLRGKGRTSATGFLDVKFNGYRARFEQNTDDTLEPSLLRDHYNLRRRPERPIVNYRCATPTRRPLQAANLHR